MSDRRIGFAIRYIPTSVAQLAGEKSASLVRGEDRHHHFMAEPQPTRDLDPEFVALRRTIPERNARILYRGTDVASYNEPKAAGPARFNRHSGPGETPSRACRAWSNRAVRRQRVA